MKKDDDLRELVIVRARATGIGPESVARFLGRRTHMGSDNLSKLFRFLRIEATPQRKKLS